MRKSLAYCFLCFLFTFLRLTGLAQTNPSVHSYTSQSVLSSGVWYKFGITSPGIYKIDKAILQTLGLAPENIDPRHIKLYGNGGQMLPQANNASRPDDLTENAIYVPGEADGKFDNADYILFYAPGPHAWQYEPTTQKFFHEFNVYADTAYYFLSVSNTPGKRVLLQPAQTGATNTIDTYHDHQFYEQDLVNLLQSGRNWYGEAFNTLATSRNFEFQLPGLVIGTTVSITSAVVGNSEHASAFLVKANETVLGTQSFSGRGAHAYHAEGETKVQTFQVLGTNLLTGTLQVNLSYDPQGTSSAVGYLDYLEITDERQLKLFGNQTNFRSLHFLNSATPAIFKIADVTAEAQVWDITNFTNATALPLQINNGLGTFIAKTDTLREYVVFKGLDFPQPFSIGQVKNQNLHGINMSGDLDLLILTHPLFKAAADKLAQHRREQDNLQVEVVTTAQVYNEFSSGSQDVTAIRDFMKMLYQRRKKTGEDVLYLLLLGDASYDYKSDYQATKARTLNNTNFVPVYESRQSLDPLKTYSSEDYYGLLDDTEGWWSEENFSTPETVDIGIGRLPVKSTAEAEVIVSKIIHYDSPASFGKWRNQIALIADDGDNAEHLRDAESLALLLNEKQPEYLVKKIYLDLFQQENGPNGQRSPATSTEIDNTVEQGSLIVNYTGHGNETWLTSEQILTSSQIAGWKNYDNLTFLLTATCEFGRYDDPKRNSGAEFALLNPQGGAIGLISTTRPVFASSNRVLNRNFMLAAFEPVNAQKPRLGDIMRKTKNNSQSNLNNRNFALLGDPSQRLAYPTLQATVTHINSLPVQASAADTLKALERITLTGIISGKGDSSKADFDGTIRVTVYDKAKNIKTLGDENSPVTNIKMKENTFYDGTATVKAGKWQVSFVVPKDISYEAGQGQVYLYAYNDKTDAQGYLNQLIMAGTADKIIPDNSPPQIKLFMDDESFVSGGLTGKSPLLLAQLFDENGINTSNTGIGHQITAILDGDNTNPIILNSFYSTQTDNFQAGDIRYLLKDLSSGPHKITLKVWDTHNNSAEATLLFTVTNDQELIISNLQNHPNPVITETTFTFDHNQTKVELDIAIHIYSVTGKLVASLYHQKPTTDLTLPQIVWNGRDQNNNLLVNGIYLYRVIVRSKVNGLEMQGSNKLLLLK